jgi:nucleolar protein 56
MFMLLITKWFGVFLIDNGNIKEMKLFPKDAGEIAKRLAMIEKGGTLNEEMELLVAHDYAVEVGEKRLTKYGRLCEKTVEITPESYGYSPVLLHEALIDLGAVKSREKVDEDFHIIQALRLVDSISESINTLSEKVRDWYSLHFPELRLTVSDEEFITLVAKFGGRDELAAEVKFIGESIGPPIAIDDLESIRNAAKTVLMIRESRIRLEKYIEKKMKEVAPNITYLAGPMIGAGLISIAGGLGKLAGKPSSTLQLLGAETALFRHLKTGVRPPKYGIIFQHPYIHGAPRQIRGKIARTFAGVISIASKVDYNKGAFIADGLKSKMERRINALQERCTEDRDGSDKYRDHKGGRGRH